MSELPTRTTPIKRKPLTLPKAQPKADSTAEPVIARPTAKRILKRDPLPAKSKSAAPAKPKPPARKRKPDPKKPITPPSAIRVDNLDAALNRLDVWRDRKPLALGIEREVFQYIAKHQLSASKRVVQKLLYRHTNRESYLRNISAGGVRYSLDGVAAGTVTRLEQEHAGYLQS